MVGRVGVPMGWGRVCIIYLKKYKNTIDKRLIMCYTVDTKKRKRGSNNENYLGSRTDIHQ